MTTREDNNPSTDGQKGQTGNERQTEQTGSSRSGMTPDGKTNETTGAAFGQGEAGKMKDQENQSNKERDMDTDRKTTGAEQKPNVNGSTERDSEQGSEKTGNL